jgi:hypothetical protein
LRSTAALGIKNSTKRNRKIPISCVGDGVYGEVHYLSNGEEIGKKAGAIAKTLLSE